MKKKKKVVIIIIIIVIALLVIPFPVPMTYKDGGTKVYNAVLYRIVVWHALDLDSPDGYKTGTDIHFIPDNFKNLSYFDVR